LSTAIFSNRWWTPQKAVVQAEFAAKNQIDEENSKMKAILVLIFAVCAANADFVGTSQVLLLI
jgi:hypothetical protein